MHIQNVPPRQRLAQELKAELRRYHQLDGEKITPVEGVIFPPGIHEEAALREEIDRVAEFVASKSEVEYKPSPSNNPKDPERIKFRREVAEAAAPWVKASAKPILEAAVAAVGDPALSAVVKLALKDVDDQFYTAPSSSTGKYHPADEINDGGLVLHTGRVIQMADLLCEYYQATPQERDLVKSALILHDSYKSGEPWEGHTKPDHGHIAARNIRETPGGDTPEGKVVQRLAANHMAAWNQPQPTPPSDKLELIVSYADYLASRDNVYVRVPGQQGG